jgi:hypothetical protein
MLPRVQIGLSTLLCVCLAPVLSFQAVSTATAQDRGRKYKAPPETAHIEVEVLRNNNGKPIANAAVVFHPQTNGKDEGNLEVKTDPEGKATIDVIPIGSTVTVQVIANGFATFAQDYPVTTDQKQISIKLLRPQEQISAYVDNSGKPSQLKPGVQEPNHPAPPPSASAAKPAAKPSTPPQSSSQSSATPPDGH